MDNKWAADHLQTIRTLMERSAIYRRALAPVSIFVGVIGIIAGLAGWAFGVSGAGAFAIYWLAVSVVAVAGALFLMRRQAVKDGENFWSPPTRRVVQAMAPALFIGLVAGLVVARGVAPDPAVLVVIWTILYGLALHAAGFFMQRGIRWFGWVFLMAGLLLPTGLAAGVLRFLRFDSPSLVMGIIFGATHLAYGIYLYFTEPRKNEA
jgi:hypothetical protein